MARNLKPNKAMANLPPLTVRIGGVGTHFTIRPHANGEISVTLRKLCGHEIREFLDQTDRDAIVRLLRATMDANEYRRLAGSHVPDKDTCPTAGLHALSRRS